VICSVDKAREIGLDWWTNSPAFTGKPKEGLPAGSPASDLEERLRRIEESLTAIPKPSRRANREGGAATLPLSASAVRGRVRNRCRRSREP
jgi:hypothetical protein